MEKIKLIQKGVDKMKLSTVDIIKHKLLDTQENARDFQEYTRRISDSEVRETFKDFAEESAMQARKLQELLSKYESLK